MLKLDSKNIIISFVIILVLGGIFSYLFGITGLRVLAGFILIILPTIIILNQFGLDTEEELILAVFLSIILFPLIVWYSNWIIPSLRVTIFIVFLVLLAISFGIRQFIHSKNDAHKDHKAVNKVVFEVLEELDTDKKINVYVFEVWNVLNETKPRMYVEVSDTFGKKIEAMKKFKSQKVFIWTLMPPVIIRAIVCGFHAKCRYAERFYKIR